MPCRHVSGILVVCFRLCVMAYSYNFVGTDILSRFPHQFAPFVGLPFGFSAYTRARYENTIIRLPLRSVPSALSRVTAGSSCPTLCLAASLGLRGIVPTAVDVDSVSPRMCSISLPATLIARCIEFHRDIRGRFPPPFHARVVPTFKP